MSHPSLHTPPTPPHFGLSGQDFPGSLPQDRLRATESGAGPPILNNRYAEGAIAGDIHTPSSSLHTLHVISQPEEARTVGANQGYPSSPRRLLPSSQHQLRDTSTQEFDRGVNSNSGSTSSIGGGGGGAIIHQQASFATHSQRSPYPSPSSYSSQRTPITPLRTPQDHPERLAEPSSVAGGVSPGPDSSYSSFAQRYESGSSSPYSYSVATFSGGSSGSIPGASRDRQPLLSVPESTTSSAVTTPSGSPAMSSAGFQRPIPRTSSIDSAISSVSVQSGLGHGQSASGGSGGSGKDGGPSPAEIQNLIQTAGSAEALIAYMVKEKTSAATQNAQLWKLVDKQRAMILGLNKDLERALKDKERYRRALKELKAHVPPIPNPSRAVNESPAPSESNGADSPRDAQPQSTSLMRSESMPLPDRSRSGSSGALDLSTSTHDQDVFFTMDRRMPSPTSQSEGGIRSLGHSHSGGPSSSSLPPTVESAEEASVDVGRPVVLQRVGNNQSTPISGPVKDAIPLRMKLGLSTAVAPVSGLGKSPLRKAPPAPLSLPLHSDSKLHDDSDDDDNVSIEEIAGYQAKKKESEKRADGRKSDTDSEKSWQHTPVDKKAPVDFESPLIEISKSASPAPQTGLSPRPQAKQPSSPLPSQSQSKGVLLSPSALPHQDSSALSPGIRQQYARAPLPSPGLPSSPRPADRPPGSPMPRMRSPSPMVGAPAPYTPGTPRTSMPQSAGLPPHSPSFKRHEKNSSTGSMPGHTKPGSIDGLSSLLITPSAIQSVDSRVVSSRMKPARSSIISGSKPRPLSEDSVFTLGIFSRASGKELLRVEKDFNALPALDARLRDCISYIVKVPDRGLFSGHSPARVDARRNAIDEYFAGIMGATMDERAALVLCEFFSTDVVENAIGRESTSTFKDGGSITGGAQEGGVVKEGYLTKRGKNFGGWKARYFVLNGPVLKYYESPGGSHLGQIKLHNAQIGRQSQTQKPKETAEGLTDAESQYRHAFLVLEPKRKDSSTLVRHVLCAENDAERDEWVVALMHYVEKGDLDGDSQSSVSQTSSVGGGAKKKRYGSKNKDSKDKSSDDSLQAVSYEETSAGAAPARGPTPEELNRMRNTPSPQEASQSSQASSQSAATTSTTTTYVSQPPAPDRGPPPERSLVATKQISGPTNGVVISDLAAWGSRAATSHGEQKSVRKRSIWGFRQRSSSDLTSQTQTGQGHDRIPVSRNVFGATLEEAVQLSKPMGVDVHLPAVVYRCIQYLDAKHAACEEGIFRLSGSNAVIRGLKERFNTGESRWQWG